MGAHQQVKDGAPGTRLSCAVLVTAVSVIVAACASTVDVVPLPAAPTALVMAGLRAEGRGDTASALEQYQRALAAAQTLYGAEHPNVAFAHAALGVWHARFGQADDTLRHLRASRRIDNGQGQTFVNIAETRLPADGSDPVARALIRLRLKRDLILCALDGSCSPARLLGLAEALQDVGR